MRHLVPTLLITLGLLAPTAAMAQPDRGGHAREHSSHQDNRRNGPAHRDSRPEARYDSRHRDARARPSQARPAQYRGGGMHDRGRHEGWYKVGGHMPRQYYHGSRYYVSDWRAARLRQPPRGYGWVRSDNGDYLLVAVATGIITSILTSR